MSNPTIKKRVCDRCGKEFFVTYKERLCKGCMNELGGEYTPKTNADRIRAMSDEEIATLIFEIAWDGEWIHWSDAKEWVKKPAEEWLDRLLKEDT